MSSSGHLRWVFAVSIALSLAGCANEELAPIEQKTSVPTHRHARSTAEASKPDASRHHHPIKDRKSYRVKAGDTLYSVAWRLGVDYRQLIQWNNIKDPQHIVVGQVLLINPTGATNSVASPAVGVVVSPLPAMPLATSARTIPAPEPGPGPERTSDAAPLRSAAPAKPAAPAEVGVKEEISAKDKSLEWAWPAEGKMSRAVSATGSIGLEIRGRRGQTVRTAGPGQVVYAGSGLRGYGQLLIIKHDERFLSAYAHNDKLLVTEGQHVDRGQPIALMGDSGASEVMLHFEIRKGGKAVEPLQYLPKR